MKTGVGVWVVLLGLSLSALAAEDPQAMISQARKAYDQGAYAQAAKLYLDLLGQGVVNAEVYYNLGNTEFKLGHLGRALGYYRRALRLAPGDEDARYNAEFLRQRIKHPPESGGPLQRWLAVGFKWFSSQGLAMAAWTVYILFMILAGVWIVRQEHRRIWSWLAAMMGAVFILLAAWTSLRLLNERLVRWGVVVAAQAEARNGPSEEYQVGFTVPEGREVRILSHEGPWVAIGLPQEGYKGWVRETDVWPDE